MTIPDYITLEDLNARERSYHGVDDPIKKEFGGVSVEITSSSRSGPYLTFRGLNTEDGYLILDVDGDRINEVIHLILEGNKSLLESV